MGDSAKRDGQETHSGKSAVRWRQQGQKTRAGWLPKISETYRLPCEMTPISPSHGNGLHGARQASPALNVAFAVFASCLQARQGVYSKEVGNRLGPHGGQKIKRNSGCPEKPARV